MIRQAIPARPIENEPDLARRRLGRFPLCNCVFYRHPQKVHRVRAWSARIASTTAGARSPTLT